MLTWAHRRHSSRVKEGAYVDSPKKKKINPSLGAHSQKQVRKGRTMCIGSYNHFQQSLAVSRTTLVQTSLNPPVVKRGFNQVRAGSSFNSEVSSLLARLDKPVK